MELLQIKSNINNNNNQSNKQSQNINKQFLNIIEKRIRKQIRVNNLIEKNMTLYVVDELTQFFIKRIITIPIIIKKIPENISVVNGYNYHLFTDNKIKLFIKKLKKNERLFLPLIMDDYCVFFLKSILSNNKEKPNKIYSFFEKISYEEIMPLINKNSIKINFNRDDEIYAFLDQLENKFSGTKHGLYNSNIYYNNNKLN